MAVWLVRAGSAGEYEQKFLQEGRVYVTWEELDVDMAKLEERSSLAEAMAQRYPGANANKIRNWVSQVWPFAKVMQPGDLVVLPLKTQSAICVAEIVGNYHFEPKGPDPFFHWRPVKWIAESVPRTHFSQDLLYSFGAFMTICRIHRNNAEVRLNAMRQSGWKPETMHVLTAEPEPATDETAPTDLEELAQDQIASLIESQFKGHNLTRLVEGILRAQGYTTYRSPEGPDGGADILAGTGPLGFGSPRLCVEVKSGSTPIDRPTVDKLLGAVTKFNAHEGLFVSWAGFKSNVQKELAQSFFRLRLWTRKDLLEQLFANYEQLEDDLKAELPLKRIWTVASEERG